jgi:tRNA nucleotidyltransferase (CCA-adding enzyme)
MAISISRDNFGDFIDFFKGRDDILKKNIRVLHDLSFIDDPTRILRAIRFEQRYNFRIESLTLKLLKNSLSLGALEMVSSHRLRDEIVLIMKEPMPIKYLKRIKELIGFSFINPNLHFSKKTESFLRSINRQIIWFQNKTPRKRALDTWLIYFIGLISDLHTRNIKNFCKKFAFSRGETKRFLSYKNTIEEIAGKLKKKTEPSQLYKCLEPLSYEVILLLRAKFENKILRKNVNDFLGIYNGVKIRTTGADLAKLSIIPGPKYKSILTKTLYAKLDKKIKTKEEELKFIQSLIEKGSVKEEPT